VTVRQQLAYVGADAGIHAGDLADYVRRAARTLDALPSPSILAGQLEWPPVQAAPDPGRMPT
jgi:hypothetical protein